MRCNKLRLEKANEEPYHRSPPFRSQSSTTCPARYSGIVHSLMVKKPQPESMSSVQPIGAQELLSQKNSRDRQLENGKIFLFSRESTMQNVQSPSTEGCMGREEVRNESSIYRVLLATSKSNRRVDNKCAIKPPELGLDFWLLDKTAVSLCPIKKGPLIVIPLFSMF